MFHVEQMNTNAMLSSIFPFRIFIKYATNTGIISSGPYKSSLIWGWRGVIAASIQTIFIKWLVKQLIANL